MSVANVAAVDAAIIAALAADATLTALVPDGVWLTTAPASRPPRTGFVIVQNQTHEDTEAFRAPLYETFQYRVTAWVLSKTPAPANAAAYRIHQLLEDTVLPMAGYTHMSTLRVDRVGPDVQIDPIDNDSRWQIAGADYEVFASPD
jgi:hypothetical protein